MICRERKFTLSDMQIITHYSTINNILVWLVAKKIQTFILKILKNKTLKLDTRRYTPEYLTEREQVKHVSTLGFTENKTLLCQRRNKSLSCAHKRT